MVVKRKLELSKGPNKDQEHGFQKRNTTLKTEDCFVHVIKEIQNTTTLQKL